MVPWYIGSLCLSTVGKLPHFEGCFNMDGPYLISFFVCFRKSWHKMPIDVKLSNRLPQEKVLVCHWATIHKWTELDFGTSCEEGVIQFFFCFLKVENNPSAQSPEVSYCFAGRGILLKILVLLIPSLQISFRKLVPSYCRWCNRKMLTTLRKPFIQKTPAWFVKSKKPSGRLIDLIGQYGVFYCHRKCWSNGQS